MVQSLLEPEPDACLPWPNDNLCWAAEASHSAPVQQAYAELSSGDAELSWALYAELTGLVVRTTVCGVFIPLLLLHLLRHRHTTPTRAAAPASPTPAPMAKPCLLLDLSHDEIGVVAHELCDPLQPLLAVHLSSTAKGLRLAMREQLTKLKQRHADVVDIARADGCSWTRVGTATHLNCSTGCGPRAVALSLAGWRMLGTLARRGVLQRLQVLYIWGNNQGDDGVESLAAGLRLGGLPSLETLVLVMLDMGPRGAAALAAALTRWTVPSLRIVNFRYNRIGDAGLKALAASFHLLPKLDQLELGDNEFGDAGLAALAPPTAGVLPLLKALHIFNNKISDRGCRALAAALRSGALPQMRSLGLIGNPASPEAQRAARVWELR